VRRADFFAIENSCRQPSSAGVMHGVSTQDAVQFSGATSADRIDDRNCAGDSCCEGGDNMSLRYRKLRAKVVATLAAALLVHVSMAQDASQESQTFAAKRDILQRDEIRFTVYITNTVPLAVYAYPKEGRMRTPLSGDYCQLGYLQAKFKVEDGSLIIERLPRFRGCNHNLIRIDLLTKTGHVSNWNGTEFVRVQGNTWKMDD
jgi:hypothetical protein